MSTLDSPEVQKEFCKRLERNNFVCLRIDDGAEDSLRKTCSMMEGSTAFFESPIELKQKVSIVFYKFQLFRFVVKLSRLRITKEETGSSFGTQRNPLHLFSRMVTWSLVSAAISSPKDSRS